MSMCLCVSVIWLLLMSTNARLVAAVRKLSDSKRKRYKGLPLNKDTRDEILRNESDNLLLYKLSPKPTPAPKSKRKNEASDDKTKKKIKKKK